MCEVVGLYGTNVFAGQTGGRPKIDLEGKMQVGHLNRSKLIDLTPNDWVLIDSRAKRLTYGLGQEIIREGNNIRHLYVIREGSAAVQVAGTSTKTRIATLVPGDVCGEIAFLTDSRATADVTAAEEHVEVDAIAARDLKELVETFPGFGTRLYRSLALILGERLRETSQELLRVMVRK